MTSKIKIILVQFQEKITFVKVANFMESKGEFYNTTKRILNDINNDIKEFNKNKKYVSQK